MVRPLQLAVLALLALGLPACGEEAPTDNVLGAKGPWEVAAGFLRDDQGRALILRGANLAGAHKSPPYFGFHQPADYARLREHWGMNSIRFLLSWAAIEPERGQYDDAYVQGVAMRVGWARDAGLLVVLDMHQDIYGEGFGGDGAPRWTCDESHYAGYEPVSPWMLNYLNPEVQACYDGLWSSEDLHDHYAEAWRRIAKALADNPAVVGFDVINEPHWGSAVMASFEEQSLQHFYEHIVPAVRQVAPHWVAFLEPSASRNIGLPTRLVPFPFPNVVYAPHSYDASAEQGKGFDPANREVLMAKLQAMNDEAASLQAALWIGEYGAMASSPGTREYMDAQYDGMASVVAGSAYWSYDRSDGYGLLDPSGAEKTELLDVIVRPYPQRIAGTPVEAGFDEATRELVVRYVADPALSAPTEIAVPSRVYPGGYGVECGGCTYSKSGEGLTIEHHGQGGMLEVRLKP